jgi:hypothetical protein
LGALIEELNSVPSSDGTEVEWLSQCFRGRVRYERLKHPGRRTRDELPPDPIVELPERVSNALWHEHHQGFAICARIVAGKGNGGIDMSLIWSDRQV